LELLTPDTKIHDPKTDIDVALVEIEDVFVWHTRPTGAAQFDPALHLDECLCASPQLASDVEHVALKPVSVSIVRCCAPLLVREPLVLLSDFAPH
jgi:hypothetical protein